MVNKSTGKSQVVFYFPIPQNNIFSFFFSYCFLCYDKLTPTYCFLLNIIYVLIFRHDLSFLGLRKRSVEIASLPLRDFCILDKQ